MPGIDETLREYIEHKKEDSHFSYSAKRTKLTCLREALILKKEAGPEESEVINYASEEIQRLLND